MNTTDKKKTRRELYDFQYNFTREEIEQKAKQLAKSCEERNRLEDQKKQVTSDFKAKIDSKNAEINILTGHINNGYEFLNKSCDVVYDFDAGVKKYYWEGILVGTEKMKQADYQLQAELEEKQD